MDTPNLAPCTTPSPEDLQAHYAAFATVRGRHSACLMVVPDGLAGKRVLDLNCRTGKGAFKLADLAGPDGFVIGCDPSPAAIEAARDKAPHLHWAHANWERHLRLCVACGEDLRSAGIEDTSVDAVFVNSALNTSYDLGLCLAELRRVLAPGGFLHLMGVFAHKPLAEPDRRALARLGNVFGTAPSLEQFRELAATHGFGDLSLSSTVEIPAEEVDSHPLLVGRAFYEAIVTAR